MFFILFKIKLYITNKRIITKNKSLYKTIIYIFKILI